MKIRNKERRREKIRKLLRVILLWTVLTGLYVGVIAGFVVGIQQSPFDHYDFLGGVTYGAFKYKSETPANSFLANISQFYVIS